MKKSHSIRLMVDYMRAAYGLKPVESEDDITLAEWKKAKRLIEFHDQSEEKINERYI